jgi:peptidoglycan/LPS O-acetylase OafA/YrhL
VLVVVLGHLTWGYRHHIKAIDLCLSVLQSGWLGVDLFFVLSGFLITGILWDAKGSDHYFRNFYARRVLRIFPLYYGVLVAVFVILPHLVPFSTPLLAETRKNQWMFWLYLANFFPPNLIPNNQYFFLSHFWTLAIEEQFYIVWPAFVFLSSRKTILRVCAGVVVVSAIVRISMMLTHAPAQAIGYFTPCRLDGLVTGAAIAIFARSPGGIAQLVPKARVIAPLAALLLLATFISTGSLPPFGPAVTLYGYTALAALFGSILVLSLTSPPSGILPRLLQNRGLLMLGKYSYGIYVFHYLLKPVTDRFISQPWIESKVHSTILSIILYTIVAFPVMLIVPFISWHVYEKQFLKLKRYFPTRNRASVLQLS